MRTTVTLDPDLDAALRAIMQERGVSFKTALNDALRDGLRGARKPEAKFVQKTFAMGEPQFRWEKALSMAESLEDEELMRKFAVGK